MQILPGVHDGVHTGWLARVFLEAECKQAGLNTTVSPAHPGCFSGRGCSNNESVVATDVQSHPQSSVQQRVDGDNESIAQTWVQLGRTPWVVRASSTSNCISTPPPTTAPAAASAAAAAPTPRPTGTTSSSTTTTNNNDSTVIDNRGPVSTHRPVARPPRPVRGPGRKHGTPVSGWQQQLASRIGGLDHAAAGVPNWESQATPGPHRSQPPSPDRSSAPRTARRLQTTHAS